jgi:hypothetical protein
MQAILPPGWRESTKPHNVPSDHVTESFHACDCWLSFLEKRPSPAELLRAKTQASSAGSLGSVDQTPSS